MGTAVVVIGAKFVTLLPANGVASLALGPSTMLRSKSTVLSTVQPSTQKISSIFGSRCWNLHHWSQWRYTVGSGRLCIRKCSAAMLFRHILTLRLFAWTVDARNAGDAPDNSMPGLYLRAERGGLLQGAVVMANSVTLDVSIVAGCPSSHRFVTTSTSVGVPGADGTCVLDWTNG